MEQILLQHQSRGTYCPDNRREKNRLKKRGVKLAYQPRFKKKGKSVVSFYVANDKINVVEDRIKLPKIGVVRLGVDLNTGSIDLSNKVSIILPKPLKALGPDGTSSEEGFAQEGSGEGRPEYRKTKRLSLRI